MKQAFRDAADLMADLKRALDGKVLQPGASTADERAAVLRWCGRWRLVTSGVSFKVLGIQGDWAYLRAADGKEKTVKVSDLELLAKSGEIRYLGR